MCCTGEELMPQSLNYKCNIMMRNLGQNQLCMYEWMNECMWKKHVTIPMSSSKDLDSDFQVFEYSERLHPLKQKYKKFTIHKSYNYIKKGSH